MEIKKILQQMTLEEKASICSGADFWKTKAIERLGIPSIMMADGPHGLRKQEGEGDHLGISASIPAVCFPSACALASSYDPKLLDHVGKILGNECQAENLAMLLGPGVNIKRSPLCGRNFEYFSEDPYVTGELASALVNGMQSEGIAACVKHYAVNNQETMRMSGNSDVDERTLHEIYLSAYETIINKSHPRSVMCAYNQVNGTFMSENHELLTKVLRDKWGFDGFVVTDWGAVKDRVKGIIAGLDLEMPGGLSANAPKIIAAVKDGTLSMETLDTTVLRLLEMTEYSVSHRNLDAVFDREKDYQETVKAAVECAVLLKNNNNLLPLSKKAKIAFIGEFAISPRYQGAGSSFINSAKISNAVAAAKRYDIDYKQGYTANGKAPDIAMQSEAVEAAKAADFAVVFAGLPKFAETEGVDRKNMKMPENQNVLIEAVAAVQPNTIVVLHNGAPIEMPWADKVPSILEMYLAGDGVGEATVSLLFGDSNPSGKLAESFPLKLEDTPCYLNFPGESGRVEYREGVFVGYRYYDIKAMDVLFPFGHGLSYTTFEYSDMKLDKKQMDDTDSLTVSVTVKNTGKVAGKEVVQLYVGDIESSVMRPQRELKAFEKIHLNPDESKCVTFRLDKRAFAYYEPRISSWFVESGDFTIEAGSSSHDLYLRDTVSVTGTTEIPVFYSYYSTMGEILKTKRGQEVLGKYIKKQSEQEHFELMADNLGEGSEQMLQDSMNAMPISTLVSFGQITEEQLEGILAVLNKNV